MVEKVIASLPGKPATYEDNARASIAAVFDWLAEPSDEAWREGECNSLAWEADAREIWPAMLAEMRKAALG